LMTLTGRFWPSRWIRSIAWYSTDGFHHESIMNTIEASVKFYAWLALRYAETWT
jgi:hypothetical protein